MGHWLRTSCPCLQTLWDRIYGPAGDAGVKAGDAPGGTEPVGRYARPVSAIQPRNTEHVLYTALWDFEARDVEELSFKAGDVFHIVRRSGDWWSARKTDTNGCVVTAGFVPRNYVARLESVESQP